MPGKAVGRAAVELPWLCPTTHSLIALADAPATLPEVCPADPALAMFLLRFAQPMGEPSLAGFAPGALLSATLPDIAASYLASTTAGVLPTVSLAVSRVRRVADLAAVIAASLARETRRINSGAAAMAARLAPLGWYAVAAIDSGVAAEPLCDHAFNDRPTAIQREIWGLDHAGIGRRLATRWRLPEWLGSTLSTLNYPLDVASRIVSNVDLFAIVQLAVLEAESRESFLGLTAGGSRPELIAHLGLDEMRLQNLLENLAVPESPAAPEIDANPHRVPLVGNLLRMAARSRRRNGPALVVRLEEQVDSLHATLVEMGRTVDQRVLEAKLEGLAELAAGAGHEINNPLAVISGNAQRLLRTEADSDRGDSLRAIIRQSHRIAGILRDLMQFARPPRPQSQVFAATDLLQGAREDLSPFAVERDVDLRVNGAPPGLWVEGDLTQLRHALGAVVRNGIEAASAPGWVHVSCSTDEAGTIAIGVEDSGAGLNPEAAEHAFDPFFCGRSAGRGRGLGLSTAWQLVRQNGGELRYAPAEGAPTRFVLTLRKAVERELLSLRSA